MKQKYKIVISSTDDCTEIECDLTDKEFKLIQQLADESRKAADKTYKPILIVGLPGDE